MKRKNKYIKIANIILLILALSFSWSACQKTDPTDCFTSTGSDINEERPTKPFRKIILNDNVNLVLTQSANSSILVTAGEKIISKIITEFDEETLIISNYNSCNWVRSFKREITVYVNIDTLCQIEYNGSGDISSTNTIQQDSLMLNIWEGAGSINLDIDVFRNYIYFHIGTADVNYSGFSHLNYISTMSFGPVDARDLETTFTYMSSSGSNNCFVKASNELHAQISSIGNVYYSGNPSISLNRTGTGELIRLD